MVGGRWLLLLQTFKTKSDMEKYKGELRRKAVLSTPPPTIDITRYRKGVDRWTNEELREIAETPKPPRSPRSAS